MDPKQSGDQPEASSEAKSESTIVSGAQSADGPQQNQYLSDSQEPSLYSGNLNTPASYDEQDDEKISWVASEFIAHPKSVAWYGILAAVSVILAVTVFFVTKDKISTGVVIAAALAFGLYANRQPRQLQYSVNHQGLTIAEKFYSFGLFRSFAIVDEGAFTSVIFMPLKRFGQLTTIYFDPNDEERIIGVLSDSLPLENHRHDAVDRLLKRIHY